MRRFLLLLLIFRENYILCREENWIRIQSCRMIISMVTVDVSIGFPCHSNCTLIAVELSHAAQFYIFYFRSLPVSFSLSHRMFTSSCLMCIFYGSYRVYTCHMDIKFRFQSIKCDKMKNIVINLWQLPENDVYVDQSSCRSHMIFDEHCVTIEHTLTRARARICVFMNFIFCPHWVPHSKSGWLHNNNNNNNNEQTSKVRTRMLWQFVEQWNSRFF